MIDFYIDQELELKAAAVNTETFDESDPHNPKNILFQPGTRVKVKAIKNDEIQIQFPNSEIFTHDPITVLTYFNIIENDKPIYTKRTVKVGPLEKSLGEYAPAEATWRKKYKTTIIVQIEELGDRDNMCCCCGADLDESLEKNEDGLTVCPHCGTSVVPVNASAFCTE